jgi:hypothetical protein
MLILLMSGNDKLVKIQDNIRFVNEIEELVNGELDDGKEKPSTIPEGQESL